VESGTRPILESMESGYIGLCHGLGTRPHFTDLVPSPCHILHALLEKKSKKGWTEMMKDDANSVTDIIIIIITAAGAIRLR